VKATDIARLLELPSQRHQQTLTSELLAVPRVASDVAILLLPVKECTSATTSSWQLRVLAFQGLTSGVWHMQHSTRRFFLGPGQTTLKSCCVATLQKVNLDVR